MTIMPSPLFTHVAFLDWTLFICLCDCLSVALPLITCLLIDRPLLIFLTVCLVWPLIINRYHLQMLPEQPCDPVTYLQLYVTGNVYQMNRFKTGLIPSITIMITNNIAGAFYMEGGKQKPRWRFHLNCNLYISCYIKIWKHHCRKIIRCCCKQDTSTHLTTCSNYYNFHIYCPSCWNVKVTGNKLHNSIKSSVLIG